MAGSSSRGRRRTQKLVTQGADARQVSFSRHRYGLFKKANEVCTLCAVETALVVFSSAADASNFGHPGVETIMNRLSDYGKPNFDAIHRAEAEQEATLRQLNKEYSDLLAKLEAEKIRGEELKQMSMESQRQGQGLVNRPLDELNLEELLTLKSMLGEFKGKLRRYKQELLTEIVASTEADSSADPRYHDVGHEH